MPNYEYHCDGCGNNFEIYQSIKDESFKVCLLCSDSRVYRVMHAVSVFSRGEPKTLIQQADRNEKKMGRFELEDKRRAHAETRVKRPKPQRPWWRKTGKVNMELAKLAPDVKIEKGKIVKSEPLSQKANDYIMKGKT